MQESNPHLRTGGATQLRVALLSPLSAHVLPWLVLFASSRGRHDCPPGGSSGLFGLAASKGNGAATFPGKGLLSLDLTEEVWAAPAPFSRRLGVVATVVPAWVSRSREDACSLWDDVNVCLRC